MNIFGCKFCKDDSKLSDDGKCITNSDEDKDRKNFDSLLWSLVTVFQVFFSFSQQLTNFCGFSKYKNASDSSKTCYLVDKVLYLLNLGFPVSNWLLLTFY